MALSKNLGLRVCQKEFLFLFTLLIFFLFFFTLGIDSMSLSHSIFPLLNMVGPVGSNSRHMYYIHKKYKISLLALITC